MYAKFFLGIRWFFPLIFSNLRPVNNLQFISKLAERAVFNPVHEHTMTFQLYSLAQSAHRTGHSTETALRKVHNDILLSMDKQRVKLLVLLDLSEAFDTVNHQVLLTRLESSFGISGTALSWLESFFDGRSQRIWVEGCRSRKFYLPYGVTQGRLGPLWFTIHARKLFEIVKAHLPDVYASADDTQLYLSFKSDSEDNQTESVDAVRNVLKTLGHGWRPTS